MSKFTSLQTKSNLIPATAFAQLPYWKVLAEDERRKAEMESQELARALFHEGASRLEQGKHLVELQKILEPYRVFVRHLKNFKMSQKTAYRRIAEFNNARRRFPEPVLQTLLAKGLDIVGDSPELPYGKYTPVMKALPVPKTTDKYQIEEWANKVESKYKEYRSDLRNGMPVSFHSGHPAPDVLMKIAFRHARMRMIRVPKGQQQKWVKDLAGYLLAELGTQASITINPSSAPDNYRRGTGRPRREVTE